MLRTGIFVQFHEKAASSFWSILYPDTAMMCADDFSGNAETETGVALFGMGVVRAVKTVKDTLLFVIRHTTSVIGERKGQEVGLYLQGKPDFSVLRSVGKGIVQ